MTTKIPMFFDVLRTEPLSIFSPEVLELLIGVAEQAYVCIKCSGTEDFLSSIHAMGNGLKALEAKVGSDLEL